MTRPRRNFVSNAELLAGIHRCKNLQCSYADEQYEDWDIITTKDAVPKLQPLFDKCAEQKWRRAERDRNFKGTAFRPGLSPLDGLRTEDLVIRVMTFEHIPPLPEERKIRNNLKGEKKKYPVTHFPPFQHFVWQRRGKKHILKCVGKSHWEGGMANGHCRILPPAADAEMGRMIWRMCCEYKRKPNFSGYPEDLEAAAAEHLLKVFLNFDESRGSNPFAYYTQIIHHSFVAEINRENKQKRIRDDLLIKEGAAPSAWRQTEEAMQREAKLYNKDVEEGMAALGLN